MQSAPVLRIALFLPAVLAAALASHTAGATALGSHATGAGAGATAWIDLADADVPWPALATPTRRSAFVEDAETPSFAQATAASPHAMADDQASPVPADASRYMLVAWGIGLFAWSARLRAQALADC